MEKNHIFAIVRFVKSFSDDLATELENNSDPLECMIRASKEFSQVLIAVPIQLIFGHYLMINESENSILLVPMLKKWMWGIRPVMKIVPDDGHPHDRLFQ